MITSYFKILRGVSAIAAGLVLSANVFAELPKTGALKSEVMESLGAPAEKTQAIGQPPISRWIYPDVTVVFEYDHVIHAFPRIQEVENRSEDQIPARPDFVNLIDQTYNTPDPNRGLILRERAPQSVKEEIEAANQAADTIQ